MAGSEGSGSEGDRSVAPALPRALLAAVIVLHLLPLAARPALIGGDEPHYALAAHSLATDLDLELADDYAAVEAGAAAAGRKRAGESLDRHLTTVAGRQLFSHPIGLPLLAAPLVALQQALVPGAAPDLVLLLLTSGLTLVALVAAWRLAAELWGGRTAILVVLGGYFSSPLWYYSRTFFTEPYTWAFAALAVVALARDRTWAAALFLALALAMKETALLLVLPILLVTWRLRGLRTALVASLGPLAFALFFVAKNLLLTGRPLVTFQPYRVGNALDGAAGLWIDPARGLLWFAPWLSLGLAIGLWVCVGWMAEASVPTRQRTPKQQAAAVWTPADWAMAGGLLAFAGYFLVTAPWIDWRGGTGYACRLLLPALPALAVPLALLSHSAPRQATASLFGVLATAGFAVNLAAAVNPVPAMWDATVLELLPGQPWAAGAGVVAGVAVAWRAGRPPVGASGS